MKTELDFEKIRRASVELSAMPEERRNAFLGYLAVFLEKRKANILAANKKDIKAAKEMKLPSAFVQRLVFDAHSLETLRDKLRDMARLESGVGKLIERKTLTGGLSLKKVRVPLGVILVIYESRPEVTIDVAALCVKSGNAAILKGGSEAAFTNAALFGCIQEAFASLSLRPETISKVATRSEAWNLLKRWRDIDLVIARGGYDLVKAVMKESAIPVLAHAAGGARIFVDSSADLLKALKIIVNAKTSKAAACNSVDTVVVHKAIAREFLPQLVKLLKSCGVRVLGDAAVRNIVTVEHATGKDWGSEFLGLTVALRIVSGVEEGVAFINKHSKRHSEGIIATDRKVIDYFMQHVDAAALFVNCSTRLHDGYIFGLGSEMGIATGKLHARGPVGLRELTTYKWEMYGKGNIRI